MSVAPVVFDEPAGVGGPRQDVLPAPHTGEVAQAVLHSHRGPLGVEGRARTVAGGAVREGATGTEQESTKTVHLLLLMQLDARDDADDRSMGVCALQMQPFGSDLSG